MFEVGFLNRGYAGKIKKEAQEAKEEHQKPGTRRNASSLKVKVH